MGGTASGDLEELALEAIRLEADSLDVEYDQGEEQVFVVKGSVGVAIATFPSTSPEAVRLRADLVQLLEGSRVLIVDGVAYELHCSVSESFGEDVYHVNLRPASGLD
jgi:hypothetical protein